MLRSLTRRLLATVFLCAVALGGGGMPLLDALVFHGPSRVAESFRPHYEASSSCHGDGCSVRALAQARFATDKPLQGLLEAPTETVAVQAAVAKATPARESVHYLSRAPPAVAS